VTKARAREILEEVAGTQLDPKVVKAFLAIEPRLRPEDAEKLLLSRYDAARFCRAWVAVGLLSGGSLRGLARYPLAGLWLPLCALLVKSGAAWLLAPQTGAVVVCLIQYSLLFVFLFLNRRRPLWPLFVFAGSLCNLLVIVLNGGCMPVSASLLGGVGERLTQLAEGRIYAYCLMDETTRLPFLGDVIRIGPPAYPSGLRASAT
jgi:hypothetical protein